MAHVNCDVRVASAVILIFQNLRLALQNLDVGSETMGNRHSLMCRSLPSLTLQVTD